MQHAEDGAGLPPREPLAVGQPLPKVRGAGGGHRLVDTGGVEAVETGAELCVGFRGRRPGRRIGARGRCGVGAIKAPRMWEGEAGRLIVEVDRS